ncbi:MAG: PEP-CTERM sorting domain-containing protein [Deltaproteobacteria bacterium]|nr:PEP-CTERM sorting domain-containing protein [Deltaproteobacteria bacterium]
MHRLAGLYAGVVVLAFAGSAGATTVTFELNFEFSGATAPEGTAPWSTITIDDTADAGGANSVRVSMTNTNLTDAEYVSELTLNLNPLLDPTDLSFTAIDTSAVDDNVDFATGVDDFQADGDGKFDVQLVLPPPPGAFAKKFTAGETISFDLTYSSALSATDFDFPSAPGGGQGSYNAAAHVQGIGPSDDDSGWIGPVPVPEPATALLLAGGLVALAAGSRRSA